MKRHNILLVLFLFSVLLCRGQGTVDVAKEGYLFMPYAVPVAFNATKINPNRMIFDWEIYEAGEQPKYFRIKCNGVLIADNIAGRERTYTYSDVAVGEYDCVLFAIYQEHIDSSMSVSFQIEPAEVSNFSSNITNDKNVNFEWKVSETGVQPQFFQIRSNGVLIADNIAGKQRTHTYFHKEIGTYDCRLFAIYPGAMDTTNTTSYQILPALPIAFDAEVVNTNNVNFEWMVSEEGVQPQSFQITNNGVLVANNIAGTQRTYTVRNVGVGMSDYRLVAIYPGGIDTSLSVSVEIPPALPIAFDAEIVDTNTVKLEWVVSEEGVQPQSFQIKCNGVVIADNIAGKQRTYTINNVKIGVYDYRLVAIYQGGIDSSWSVLVEISPASIENFTHHLEDINNVRLQWEVSQDGVQPQFFQILRNGNKIVDSITEELSYFDTNLNLGTYTYIIKARYANDPFEYLSEEGIVLIDTIDYALPINFRSVIEQKDVLMFWNMTQGEEMPLSFQIKRNDTLIWETNEELQYQFRDTNVAYGTHTYRLYALYANGMIASLENELQIMLMETSDSIIIGDNMEYIVSLLDAGAFLLDSIHFTYTVEGNNVKLNWTIAEEAIQPASFQLIRNGEPIANLDASQRIYLDANLEAGAYLYILHAYFTENKTWTGQLICTINCN